MIIIIIVPMLLIMNIMWKKFKIDLKCPPPPSLYQYCNKNRMITTLLYINIDKGGQGRFISVFLTFCHTIILMILVKTNW